MKQQYKHVPLWKCDDCGRMFEKHEIKAFKLIYLEESRNSQLCEECETLQAEWCEIWDDVMTEIPLPDEPDSYDSEPITDNFEKL